MLALATAPDVEGREGTHAVLHGGFLEGIAVDLDKQDVTLCGSQGVQGGGLGKRERVGGVGQRWVYKLECVCV